MTKLALILCACLVAAGCDNREKPKPSTASILILLPGESEAIDDIVSGAMAQFKPWGIDAKTHNAGNAARLGDEFRLALKDFPDHVIVPSISADASADVVKSAFDHSVYCYLVGLDVPSSPRSSSIAPDGVRIANSIVASLDIAKHPGAYRILITHSNDTMVDSELIYARLVSKYLPNPSVTVESAAINKESSGKYDAVIAVGAGAIDAVVGRESGLIIGIDGGKRGIAALREMKLDLLYQPNWFQAGALAARAVADSINKTSLPALAIEVPVNALDHSNVDTYIKTYRVLPAYKGLTRPLPKEEQEGFDRAITEKGTQGKASR